MKLPENFIENSLGDIPSRDNYVGYLYRFINLENLKQYLGIHKGFVGDGYWHSSENKEFKEIFQNSSSRLRFEILEYSNNWGHLKNKEYTMLHEANAVKNPQYYNKSNGSPMYKVPRLDPCSKFVEDILGKEKYKITQEPIENHVKMPFIQARFEDDAQIQVDVKNLIDDAGGSTNKCNPVVVYEERMFKGEIQDVRGDGTQTVMAADRAKHATTIPVMRIPKTTHAEFTDHELEGIGNLLNRKDEIRKSPVKEVDGIKFVKGAYYAQGVAYDDLENYRWLETGYRFSKAECTKIIEKAGHQIITEEEARLRGKYFRNYAASPYKGILANKVKQNITDTQIALQMSSGKFNFDRIADLVYEDSKESKRKTRVKVLMYHPHVPQSEKWKMEIQPFQLNKTKWYLNDKGYEVEFEEQPMWEESEKMVD